MKILSSKRLIKTGLIMFGVGLVVGIISLLDVYHDVADCLNEQVCEHNNLSQIAGQTASIFMRVGLITIVTGMMWRIILRLKK